MIVSVDIIEIYSHYNVIGHGKNTGLGETGEMYVTYGPFSSYREIEKAL